MSKGKSTSFLFGTALGAAMGAVAALLYAPQKGEATRRKLETAKVKLSREAQKIQDKVEKEGGLAEIAANTLTGFSQSVQEASSKLEEKMANSTPSALPAKKRSSTQKTAPRSTPKKPRFFRGGKNG